MEQIILLLDHHQASDASEGASLTFWVKMQTFRHKAICHRKDVKQNSCHKEEGWEQ